MSAHDDLLRQEHEFLEDMARRIRFLAEETLAHSKLGKGVLNRKGYEAFYHDVHDLAADLFSVASRMGGMYMPDIAP
jgi:hypothetical protein